MPDVQWNQGRRRRDQLRRTLSGLDSLSQSLGQNQHVGEGHTQQRLRRRDVRFHTETGGVGITIANEVACDCFFLLVDKSTREETPDTSPPLYIMSHGISSPSFRFYQTHGRREISQCSFAVCRQVVGCVSRQLHTFLTKRNVT